MIHPSHCTVCPTILNREKQLAVAIDALRFAATTETRQALRSIAVLAGLEEPVMCEAWAGKP